MGNQSIEQLEKKVIQWASDKGIYTHSTVEKQLDKASEEFNELQRAIGVYDYVCQVEFILDSEIIEAEKEVKDAFGDILVCLINAMYLHGYDIKECLELAYNTIKDRKGVMINGKLVKESDNG